MRYAVLATPRHALNSLVESEAVWATSTPGLKRRTWLAPPGGPRVGYQASNRSVYLGRVEHTQWQMVDPWQACHGVELCRPQHPFWSPYRVMPPTVSSSCQINLPVLGLIAQQSPPMRSIPVKGGGCPLLQFSTGPQQPRGGALGLFLEQRLKRESQPMAATRSSGLFGWLLCTSSCFVEHQVSK